MPLACFAAIGNVQRITQHAKGMSLRYGVIVLGNLIRFFTKKSFYHQGGMDRSEIHGIDFRFQHLVGDHLLVAKLIAEEEKYKFTHP